MSFPDGFLWGAATAAHQVEGGNVNNDWWEWEHRTETVCVEPSGDCCDHYHRYGEDVAIMADLGVGVDAGFAGAGRDAARAARRPACPLPARLRARGE